MDNTGTYQQIAAAIQYINEHVTEQPSLNDVAQHVHMSPTHFQRLFTEWAGVSPKRFLQFLTIRYAKQLLSQPQHASLFDAAEETGLSGTGRLHDLFVNIEGMTPGEFRNGGKNLQIRYSLQNCRFGNYLVASTGKGICNLSFFDENEDSAIKELQSSWNNAHIFAGHDQDQQQVIDFLEQPSQPDGKIRLHVHGTGFQIKVWEALLKIPEGALSTYGSIAANIRQTSAARAVGSAIAGNQVAFIIPCHRVIRNVGAIGEFRWGTVRKQAMIGWEAGRVNSTT